MADLPAKRTKRRVKNPETFRERAIKAGEKEESSGKRRRVRQLLAIIFSPVGSGIRGFFSLGIFKPFRRPARFIGRILLPRYFRESWRELKLVQWPSWQVSRRLTFAVIIFAIVFGLSVAGVDWVLNKAFRQLLLR